MSIHVVSVVREDGHLDSTEITGFRAESVADQLTLELRKTRRVVFERHTVITDKRELDYERQKSA